LLKPVLSDYLVRRVRNKIQTAIGSEFWNLTVAFRILEEPYMKPNSQFHSCVELELRFVWEGQGGGELERGATESLTASSRPGYLEPGLMIFRTTTGAETGFPVPFMCTTTTILI
jgi:hypothetical protein